MALSVGDLTVKVSRKHTAEMLSTVSTHKKAGMGLMEKIRMLEKLLQACGLLLGMSSMSVSQQRVLYMVSLNRNTHKIRLGVVSMKML